MEELLALSSHKIKIHKTGDKIDAKLVEMTNKSATFDIGGKSEAILSDEYFSEAKSFLAGLNPGDKVQAVVVNPETVEGKTLISLHSLVTNSAWRELVEKQKKDKSLSVLVKNVGERGLSVEYGPLAGFIPKSQLGKEARRKGQKLVGEMLRVKVIEVVKAHNKLLFSERAVSEAEDIAAKKEAAKKIKIGEIYKGTVVQIANFGVFVEIKVDLKSGKVPIQGLVHVSEISWDKVVSPAEVLSEGDEVKIKVIDKKEDTTTEADMKLAFSIRQTQRDPWEEALKKLKPDTKTKGEVVRVSDFGVFVQLSPGVEGLIHITKIPPARRLKKGEMVDVYIEEVSKKDKRISLGLVLTAKPVGYK